MVVAGAARRRHSVRHYGSYVAGRHPGRTGARIWRLCFVEGIFAVIAGIGMRQTDRWWLIVLEGAAGIILSLLIFRSPDITALVTLIAAWSIITGIFEIATAARLRKMIPNEWLRIVSGVVSIIFGILLITQPGAGAISIVWLLGAYALLFGILTLMLAFRLRGMRERLGRRAAGTG